MNKKIAFVIILVLIVAGIYYFENSEVDAGCIEPVEIFSSDEIIPSRTSAEKDENYTVAKEITSPDCFINTDGEEISIQDLIGEKVVLIDFWTYSCINCQRTFPYLNAWYDKYKDQGLEIIAIHTPEFEFEKKYENVLDATKRFDLKYPVVMDNDFSTWRSYKNRFWPRKYIIDIDGYVVYDHAGEGAYQETELIIQELLEERSERLGIDETVRTNLTNFASERNGRVLTPEIYFGSLRNSSLGNGEIGRKGKYTFEIPQDLEANLHYLGGEWNIDPEFAENTNTDAKIVLPFFSKDLFMVAESDNGVEIEVSVDGESLSKYKGRDIKNSGGKSLLQIGEAKLYKIFESDESGPHLLELNIKNPGLKAFTFTFG